MDDWDVLEFVFSFFVFGFAVGFVIFPPPELIGGIGNIFGIGSSLLKLCFPDDKGVQIFFVELVVELLAIF